MLLWMKLGPQWKTEKTFRALEVLKAHRIRFKMPSDDMFFASPGHLPHPDRRWEILVKRKDRGRALAALAQAGVIDAERPAQAAAAPTAKNDRAVPGHSLSMPVRAALPGQMPF